MNEIYNGTERKIATARNDLLLDFSCNDSKQNWNSRHFLS